MAENLISIEKAIVDLLQEIYTALPQGCAELTVHRSPQIKHSGVSVRLRPRNPAAAPVVADAEDGDSTIYMWLGESTPYEVLPHKGLKQLEEARAVVLAVVNGQFQENLWFHGSELTKCAARITIGGKELEISYYGRFFPFKEKRSESRKYQPYRV